MVLPEAMDRHPLRNRPAPGRLVFHCDALAGGQEFPNLGCYLEIVPNERLVFTDTMLEGYRPSPKPFFTAVLHLEPKGSGTRYTAIAIHGNEETRKNHEQMGFYDGWGTVVDQMVAVLKQELKKS